MSKPADGEYSRSSDPQNKSLPPSVRIINYAKAAVTAWPIVLGLVGLLGYTNADKIPGLRVAEADGKTEVLANGSTFAESMVKYTQEMNARVDALEGTVAVQKADLTIEDRKNVKQLRAIIAAMDARLKVVEGLVQ